MELFTLTCIYIAGLALLIVEVFVPGGIVGSLAAIAVVGSIWAMFSQGHVFAGTVCTSIAAVTIPLLVWWGIRRFTFKATLAGAHATGKPVEEARGLIGARGTAVTSLRPAGTAMIEGRRYDVMTEGAYIEAKAPVEIVGIESNAIIVRAVRDVPVPTPDGARSNRKV